MKKGSLNLKKQEIIFFQVICRNNFLKFFKKEQSIINKL